VTASFELGTDGPTRILVGVDGSESSMHAGAYAAGLARRQNATLVALYVVSTASVSAQVAATAGALIQTHQELGRELRDAVVQAGERNGFATEFVQRTGNPYKELIAVAKELRVDAIVVGASMQSGHRLVGSLAGRLVRDAAWPVTVVP
jgi:nucleotide-binding universal stress UspA family protein